ncbi:MAG TPA: tetratricopeptide repeat protein, partial [Spirochaetes bacterium]|nr:tetratricopeptide repeat protein [Spirochaetota bacterium]
MSQIYLKLAKSLSFQEDKKKNDYQKALTFYQRALEMGALKEEEGDTRYRIALCYFHLKKYQESKKVLNQFITKFPDSSLTRKVHFYLGEIERHLGYLYKSRTHYLKVLKSKKEKEEDLSPKTLYHIGKSYRLPAPYTENELELGVKYWKILIEKYPKHKLAAQVAYEIGLSYNRFSHLRDQGIQQLLKFVEVYPKNKNAPIALQLVGNIYFNQKKYDQSIVYYTQYLGSYPNHRLWRTVQQQIINAKYTKGNHLYQLKKYPDAEGIYQSFLKEYPIDSRNPQILYNLGDISFQEKKYDEAIERWEKLFSKYPNYAIAHKALYSVGKYYSDTTHEFDKAIKTFKKVKHNPWYTMAQSEIRTLNTKSLSLETKKLFLSSQKPSIHVKVRNIEEFKVDVYRLDLNEYFSRNHTLKKVEQLDILLIKSDESFTHKVDSYKKHLLYVKDLDLKIDRAGAYVISISSETLKASTLLLVSDLAVSVESNKSEILVYAKNLSKEKGEGQAKVYVSNGKKIILEGQTDGQGILHHRFTKPQRKESLDQLTVLVEKNGSYAGTALNNRRYRSHDEKEYLGYIYSDKPVYKPGDSFSYKGILRKLYRGQLSRINTGQYRVKFISPTGKTIYEKNVSQSDYGSIHGRLSLPKTLATGWAKLRIESIKDKTITFEKSFEIAKYTKLEKEILFETDKVAYFP